MKRIISLYLVLLCVAGAMAQSHSVLSSGRWWKLAVADEGVYRINTSVLPGLLGSSIDSLSVYGLGGGPLSPSNSQTSIDDLRQLAIEVIDHNGNGLFDAADELLFFGEGADRWIYSDNEGRWLFEHHPYARENYYYLTASCASPKRISLTSVPSADASVNKHSVVAHVDNDMVNIYHTGQVWVGEKLSSALTRRTFDLRLPGSDISNLRLRWAVASASTTAATFTLSTDGYQLSANTSSSNSYTSMSDAFSASRNNYTFTLNFSATDNAGVGYLDYIELCAKAVVSFNGGQTLIRQEDTPGRSVRYEVGGNAAMRVWEVSRSGNEYELPVNNHSWNDSSATLHKYILFDAYSYLTPSSATLIDNQDLHGSAAAKMIIVTHPLFLSQAQRLATMHELMDGLSTLVVTDQQVYNEFSSGKQDPMAIRGFLRWLKRSHPAVLPRYLLLFGKGTYDNRDLLGNNLPTVVTFESPYSFDDDGSSYASDDMMGYLAPNGYGNFAEQLDVSVGRLPAKSITEAELMVDKIEGYLTRRDLLDDNNRGDWRNYVALLADDADPGRTGDTIFAHSSENIASNIKDSFPQMNIDRLYADAYRQASGAIGSYYPDLNNALRQRIDYGCLLLNYIGHGSTAYIGTERYIELANISAYTNTDRLPLFVTSTCSYGRYDGIDELCGAEACLLAPAAMIGVISASRPISHVERFNSDVVLFALDPENTIGDALRKAKNRTAVSPSIGLIGDPALRLSQPRNRVQVTHINSLPVDDSTDITADVLSRVTVSGQIVDDDGNLIPDFDGTLYPVVYDREMRSTTLANDNPGTEVSFWQQKNILYKGSHPVQGGRFEYSFIVPRDVSYRYDYAKLSHYAKSVTDHASGSFLRLMLGGLCDSALAETTPPEVTLFIGDTNFRSGGLTGPSPTLLAFLSDSAGINPGTGLGHDITAIIDDNPNSLIVLNDLFQTDISDSRCGSVAYTLRDLTPGRHSVTVKAWNIFGISASSTVHFTVRGTDTLAFSSLACSPNPATTTAAFSLRVNDPSAIASAELQIYNSHGQLIATHTPNVSTSGFIVGPVLWNVASVPPGLYLARMVITDTEGETHQITTKCIVR